MEQFQSMRKSLAHSKLTSHAVGPSDLRPLNDLLASEKDVLNQMLRLSACTKKSSETLREWGAAQPQGDDLTDILGKVSFLFEQLGKAQAKYAEHLSTFRSYFKDLRTREEGYLALRRARDALQGKIDSADKQNQKTSAEHKEKANREQKLYELKQEMVGLQNSLINEEARLGDEKRRIARDALALKLGALLELGERQTVVSEMSRVLVSEIPQDKTEPGQNRVYYDSYQTTEETMQEAQRCLTSLVFNPTTESQTPLPNPSALKDASESVQRLQARRSMSQRSQSRPLYQSTASSEAAPQLPQFTHLSPPSSPALAQGLQQQPPTPSETGLPPSSSNFRRQSQQQLAPSPYGGGTFDDDQGSGLAYLGSSISVGDAPPALPAGAAPSGPPNTYDAANGRARHGSRAENAPMQYDFQDDRHWVRNQAASPEVSSAPPPPSAPVSAPNLPSPRLQQQQEEQPPPPPPSQTAPSRPELPTNPSRTYYTARPDPPKKQRSLDVAPAGPPTPSSADPDRPQLPKLPSHMGEFHRSSMGLSTQTSTSGAPPSPSNFPQPPAPPPTSSATTQKPSAPTRKLSSPPTSPVNQSMPVLPSAHDFYNARVSANEALQNSLPTAPPRVAPVVSVPGRNSFIAADQPSPTSANGPQRPNRSRGDSTKLGSKHGFDDPAYRGEAEPTSKESNRTSSGFPQIRPSTRDNTGPPSGYTYHPPGQSYSAPTSAFVSGGRRGQPSSASSGVSPAMLIQQEYMRKERESLERERDEQERAAAAAAAAAASESSASAADPSPASTEQGHARDGSESSSVAPLKLNKRRSEDPSAFTHAPANSLASLPPYAAAEPQSPAPIPLRSPVAASNRYVTRLD